MLETNIILFQISYLVILTNRPLVLGEVVEKTSRIPPSYLLERKLMFSVLKDSFLGAIIISPAGELYSSGLDQIYFCTYSYCKVVPS